MAIRYGKLNPRNTPDPPMPPLPNQVPEDPPVNVGTDAPLPCFGPEPLPDYFNSDLLEPLEKSQVAYWDETHRMCDLTDSLSQTPRGKNYVYRVRRDEINAIDSEGSFKNTDPTKLNVKYDEEIRLALGVFFV